MKYSSRDRFRWIGAAAMASLPPLELPAQTGKYSRNLTKDEIDRWMTELSNWGRWGQDDQAGTVNLITPAKRKQAAAPIFRVAISRARGSTRCIPMA